MFKCIAMLFVVCLLLLSVVGQANAGGQWFLYLYNSTTRHIIRVYQDGTTEDFDLGLPADTNLSAWNLSFDVNTTRVAFCTTDYNSGIPIPPAKLYIRDLSTSTNILEKDLGNAMACQTNAFNADENLLAVSLANYYPGDPNADLSKPAWQMFLLDITTGNVVYELNPTSPAGTFDPAMTLLPTAPYFASGLVVMVAVPFGIGGSSDFPSYMWDYNANTLAPIDNWGNLGVSTFGGELVWIGYDDTLPAAEPFGPVPFLNSVYAADKSGSQTKIFYTADFTPLDTEYINGGQMLAISLYAPFDPNTQASAGGKWVALDRSGAVLDITPMSQGYQLIKGMPSGFALLTSEFDPNSGMNNFSLNFSDGVANTLIWQSGLTTDYWDIPYAVPLFPTDAGVNPFPPVQ